MTEASKRLLLIEDAEDIRSGMAELLEDEGYEVICATNGREALEQLASAAELPRLILLDLMMPEMDGYAFCAARKRDAKLADIPVLLMTAATDAEVKAGSLGVHGYLKKPFADIDSILKAVAQFF